MENGVYISMFTSGLAVFLLILGVFCWHYRGQPFSAKVKEFLGDVKRIIRAPFEYFFGYECRICGKVYLFNSHKAFMCCPGIHNEQWRREHPHEKCLTAPSTLTIQQQLKAAYGDRYWEHVNPDHYLRTCPWCGGTGRKYGVMCDECGGLGKLPK